MEACGCAARANSTTSSISPKPPGTCSNPPAKSRKEFAVTESIHWRIISGRWPHVLGIPFVVSGGLISTLAVTTPPPIYGGLAAGIVMVVFGAWIIWNTRKRSSWVLSTLAGATVKIWPEAPQPGDVLNCTLALSPNSPVRIFEWSISVFLVEPESEEDETYWSEIESTEYRHSFSQPPIIGAGQTMEFIGSIDMPGLGSQTEKGENIHYVSWLRIEVRTSLYLGRLQSATIKLTTPDTK